MTLSRVILRTIIAAALVAMPAVFTTSATSPENPCAALTRWAERYRGTAPSLDEIVTFDRAHRTAIFNAVGPDVRAAWWREHLRRFGRRPDLSTEQRALVAEAVTLATPALYARQPGAIQRFEERWPRIDRAFVEREHRRAWFDLGSVVDSRIAVASTAADRIMRPFTLSAQSSWCGCSFYWDDCWSGSCVSGGCNFRGGGCGPMGGFPCDGRCP